MSTLEGKVAVVTGAGRGLGREFATGLAREGARVVAVGRRLGPATDAETLEHTVALIREAGGEATPSVCDVGDPSQVARMAQQVADAYGGVDILVNNAGLVHPRPFAETTPELWEETLRTFLSGAFYCCRALVPMMAIRGGGSIVNLDSDYENPQVNYIAYAVVRAGLRQFTFKMAPQLRDQNIAINSVAPGFTATDWVKGFFPPAFDTSWMRKPTDPVPAVVWLAGQTAGTCTGQAVQVADFGRTWGPGVAAPAPAPA